MNTPPIIIIATIAGFLAFVGLCVAALHFYIVHSSEDP